MQRISAKIKTITFSKKFYQKLNTSRFHYTLTIFGIIVLASLIIANISGGINVKIDKSTVEFVAEDNNFDNTIEILGTSTVNTSKTTNDNQNNLQSQGANLSDYEAAVLYLINTVRVSNGLATLQPNQQLTDIARTRSNDMLARGYFSHYTPEGKTVFNIMRECGITFKSAGENLAHSKPADIGSPEAFLNAWMNSPSHAANILRDKYGIIGVGMVENGDRRVVTTVFRNP